MAGGFGPILYERLEDRFGPQIQLHDGMSRYGLCVYDSDTGDADEREVKVEIVMGDVDATIGRDRPIAMLEVEPIHERANLWGIELWA